MFLEHAAVREVRAAPVQGPAPVAWPLCMTAEAYLAKWGEISESERKELGEQWYYRRSDVFAENGEKKLLRTWLAENEDLKEIFPLVDVRARAALWELRDRAVGGFCFSRRGQSFFAGLLSTGAMFVLVCVVESDQECCAIGKNMWEKIAALRISWKRSPTLWDHVSTKCGVRRRHCAHADLFGGLLCPPKQSHKNLPTPAQDEAAPSMLPCGRAPSMLPSTEEEPPVLPNIVARPMNGEDVLVGPDDSDHGPQRFWIPEEDPSTGGARFRLDVRALRGKVADSMPMPDKDPAYGDQAEEDPPRPPRLCLWQFELYWEGTANLLSDDDMVLTESATDFEKFVQPSQSLFTPIHRAIQCLRIVCPSPNRGSFFLRKNTGQTIRKQDDLIPRMGVDKL